ncbi:MAG: hypothetical protein HKN72_14065 [Gemmatimonadetes bacterium]|nr:hypothetical protein [Gemmatimonadota bacterium]
MFRLTDSIQACVPVAVAVLMVPSGERDPRTPPWGYKGHEMATQAALGILPQTVPDFFVNASDQLIYLSPEPDRWRIRAYPELDRAGDYDHYVDLENLPDGALDARDRFSYLGRLHDAGVSAREGGLLLFRIVELHQRVASLWERWHAEDDPDRRRFIEARLIDDAGVLGHYVTDASQPHHTTIHFDGWDSDAPNPEGFSVERGFHARFETRFVNAHITLDDIVSRLPPAPRTLDGQARPAVVEHILASHARLGTLYRLDRDAGFNAGQSPHPDAKAFAAERLAAGAEMLATLWWSAYVAGTEGR